MFYVSAVNRSAVLLAAMLGMAALNGFLRMPDVNMPVFAFTFLSSALLADITPFARRMNIALLMALFSSLNQFLISGTHNWPVLQIIVSSLFAFFTFIYLPDLRAGCIVLITGFLSYSAPSAFLPAVGRSIDIFIGVIVIAAVTSLFNASGNISSASSGQLSPCPKYRSFLLAAALAAGNLISQMLRMKQGIWVMLTVLFISMSESQQTPGNKLAIQRIFAVPAGIISGGLLLDSFCRMDYRFVYIVPFLGAAGFFILYNYNDFFLFSVIFMVSLTVFADWTTGPYHRFHFWNALVSRSAAALLGAVIYLFFPNTASRSNA